MYLINVFLSVCLYTWMYEEHPTCLYTWMYEEHSKMVSIDI